MAGRPPGAHVPDVQERARACAGLGEHSANDIGRQVSRTRLTSGIGVAVSALLSGYTETATGQARRSVNNP